MDNVKGILSTPRFRISLLFVTWVALLTVFVDAAAASNGMTLSKEPRDALAIPQWLYLATGSAAIGGSALLASFVTDRLFIQSLHRWSRPLFSVDDHRQLIAWIGRSLGVTALVLAIYLGYTGPQLPTASFTILVTFVIARAGLPMIAYLAVNVWPIVNPWRAISSLLPSGFRDYPLSWQRWPAVVGLLLLVWVELVFPVSTVPAVLATAILCYSIPTLIGAILFGHETWFANGDPLSVLFRLFGAVAPVQYDNGALSVQLPGSDLTDPAVVTDTSDVAFIIALIWELTYSGFITTTTGAAAIESLVALSLISGVSTKIIAVTVYMTLFISGYVAFFGAYWYASKFSRRSAETYITSRTIALRFAPPLLAIAAGYHLAHYAGLFVSLSPALGMVLSSPLSPPANPMVLSLPSWFDASSIVFVLVGHLLAIWTAHVMAYDLFPSRITAVRSQYPFIVVMIGYTVISLWILSVPGATPPYLS